MKVYVDRDANSAVVGVYVRGQYKGQEHLEEDDSDVTAFRNLPQQKPKFSDVFPIDETTKQNLRDAKAVSDIVPLLVKIILNE